ncbi:ABC transporter ATP-binding protein/permease [Rodentibacter caecimuris]|uniref:ABC transporter ATP-binding protein n=1 Tax=Rodentibacter caecimuris TaxID=1796644 RepID=A0ABX3KYP2_9PAST|nr:ABC transporter ATP-binding protein [Rodentibacter heylii]
MMIDKRLINTVNESKKWIAINVLWNWIGLIAAIVSSLVFAFSLQSAFDHSLNASSAVIFFIILLIALITRAFAANMAVKASYRASTRVKHQLRSLIYQKLSSMPLNQVNRQSTSSIIQVASEGVEQLEIYFGRYLPQLFYSLLAPITLFIFLMFFNIPASLILLLCVPLIPLSIIAVNKIAKRLLAKYWAIYVGLGSSFLDNLQGLITLKVYQDDAYKAKQMDIEAEKFRTVTMKVLTMQLNSVSIMDLLAYGGAAVGILTALLQFNAGNLTVLAVILFILLSSEFFIPLRLLGSFFHVAMNGKAASDKIFSLLDTPIEQTKSAVDFSLEDRLCVDIQNLHFAYNKEKSVFEGLNLTIEPHKLTVFVGESGCGKSTLVSLLMGFYQPQQGQILFNGQAQENLTRHSLNRYISLVGHSSYIFKGSVRENMLMADVNATDSQIYECLEQVNLADFVRNNGGLDMPLLSRAANLSGGQIQRLALARALLHNADLYIFDEATSNIDVESEEIILRFIHKLKVQKTIIMVSHRLANAIAADHIYVLQQGKLVEQGNHTQLMAQSGIYQKMFNRQQALENIRKEVNNA